MTGDCDVCAPDPLPPHSGPGVLVRLGGTRHRASCPLLPRLTPEQETQLREDLTEMAECRRRSWAASRDVVIG